LFNQTNETNQINQSNEPGAGGGFQHMLVDSHHGCLCLITTRHLFAGKLESLLHRHAGTRIAFQVCQEHMSQP
jgi:hypothetical protein